MKFWMHVLDPTINRKIKGLILATVLLVMGFITPQIWGISFLAYIGAISYEKVKAPVYELVDTDAVGKSMGFKGGSYDA